jgi:chemotaxis signal transduction protein
LIYHAAVPSLPSERKALLFSAGGVRLALRLSHIREILQVARGDGEVRARGEVLPVAFVAAVLGLPPGAAPWAIAVEGAALRVEAVHGIVDLAGAEVFQLPARTPLPQPPPFSGAIVRQGEIALELAPSAIGWAPLAPAEERAAAPPDLDAPGDRELRFARGGRTFGVPLSLLVQVLEAPRLAPVPLTPPSHRGLVYHGRAIHPVVDVAVLYGDAPAAEARAVLLVDVGGTGVGLVADRVLGVGEGGHGVLRPPWDAVFPSP